MSLLINMPDCIRLCWYHVPALGYSTSHCPRITFKRHVTHCTVVCSGPSRYIIHQIDLSVGTEFTRAIKTIRARILAEHFNVILKKMFNNLLIINICMTNINEEYTRRCLSLGITLVWYSQMTSIGEKRLWFDKIANFENQDPLPI